MLALLEELHMIRSASALRASRTHARGARAPHTQGEGLHVRTHARTRTPERMHARARAHRHARHTHQRRYDPRVPRTARQGARLVRGGGGKQTPCRRAGSSLPGPSLVYSAPLPSPPTLPLSHPRVVRSSPPLSIPGARIFLFVNYRYLVVIPCCRSPRAVHARRDALACRTRTSNRHTQARMQTTPHTHSLTHAHSPTLAPPCLRTPARMPARTHARTRGRPQAKSLRKLSTARRHSRAAEDDGHSRAAPRSLVAVAPAPAPEASLGTHAAPGALEP